jgi:type II secretory pathway pseudopilin PulG
MLLSKSHARTKQPSRGFGLVELMVSISIMVLVMTVILVRQRSFDNAVLMRNQAYELAFALREAQLLAVSGVDESAGSNPTQFRRYGVQFSSTTGQYITFRDANADGRYTTDTSGDVQIGVVGRLDRRFRFGGLRAGSENYQVVSVTFVRPNFDAVFREQDGGTFVAGPMTITIGSATGGSGSRQVSITSAGNISVPTN